MTQDEIRKHFPFASKSCLEANGAIPSSKSKQVVRNEPMAEEERKAINTTCLSRISVTITSYRRRLLDPDNLAGGCKYFLDCCKYSKLIPDDRPQDIELHVSQEKVKSKDQERTKIEVELL